MTKLRSSTKSSRKPSKRTSRKTSKRTSRKTSKRTSRKTSKRTSRKPSKRTSRKPSKRTSRRSMRTPTNLKFRMKPNHEVNSLNSTYYADKAILRIHDNNGGYLFNQSYWNKEERDKFNSLLYNILVHSEPKITEYLNQGTTKIVFNTSDKTKVFKLIIISVSLADRMILEPLYMLDNLDICNRVYDINIYGNIKNDKINAYKVNNLGDYCLITWYEDKAIKTGISNFDLDEKEEAIKFMESTTERLDTDGFQDLGDVNIGLFDKEPRYRWIDIQPKKK